MARCVTVISEPKKALEDSLESAKIERLQLAKLDAMNGILTGGEEVLGRLGPAFLTIPADLLPHAVDGVLEPILHCVAVLLEDYPSPVVDQLVPGFQLLQREKAILGRISRESIGRMEQNEAIRQRVARYGRSA
jgi:hypothetical protein